jgi:putative nucleotidyltransferase with HDIG domain
MKLTQQRGRVAIVAGIITILMIFHWSTPMDTSWQHAAHVFLRKLFYVPVILAAIWFDFFGILTTCAVITVAYFPFIFIAWQGNINENIDQLTELLLIWLGGILLGYLAAHEKRQQERLLHIHEGAVVALVTALDAREHDTQLHSLRVQAYALRLGRELNMSERDLLSLGQGALLHDIGKIGIPDGILMKEGPLDAKEWEMMRQHPAIGKSILDHANFLRLATDVVYSHHERYDGKGYPRGLAGEEISLGARVFSVVDAFDALTSKRPYQDEIEFQEALHRLQQSSGTYFDPAVLDKFSRIREAEWKKIADQVEAKQKVERDSRHQEQVVINSG